MDLVGLPGGERSFGDLGSGSKRREVGLLEC